MNTIDLSLVGKLSNQEVVAGVKLLVQGEREATAALIAHLAVLGERKLYLAEGCSSMFTYCTQVLHLSESAAYSRVEAAKAARRFPVILGLLSDGSVNLTTVGLLVPELTPENYVELLDTARHKSKREVQELVARLRPRPPVPSCIRRLPTAGLAARVAAANSATVDLQSLSPTSPSTVATIPMLQASGSARRPVIAPLAPQCYKIQFTASEATHAKLMRVQELLRTQIPRGDIDEIIDRALTALLSELGKRKFAATDRPRERGASKPGQTDRPRSRRGTVGGRATVARTRHIRAEVKRTVWKRDSGQCAFAAKNRRCTARAFLEFHHVVPYSAGGVASVENIQLRCRAHNVYEAETRFDRRNDRWGDKTMGLVQEQPPLLIPSPQLGPDPVDAERLRITNLAIDPTPW